MKTYGVSSAEELAVIFDTRAAAWRKLAEDEKLPYWSGVAKAEQWEEAARMVRDTAFVGWTGNDT